MKKKLATLLVFLFSCLCAFTGCNLFITDSTSSLNAIVAKSGNIEITREQLINAYNSSGYYYDQYYGYTMENALKQTINDLIDREYLLKYIDSIGLTLTEQEKYNVILETWEVIDTSINSIAEQLKSELAQEEVEEDTSSSSEGEYKGYSPYTSKFKSDIYGNIIKIREQAENNYIPTITENTKYQYKVKISGADKDFETIVWNKYISNLKQSESFYKYDDVSDSATFKRQIDKIYKSNLENAKITKFQNHYENSFGVEFNEEIQEYVVNEKTKQDIIDAYTKVYDSNKQFYDLSKSVSSEQNPFYSSVTNTSNRENFVYFGEGDEDLLTCLHILVKISDEQKSKIESLQSDPYIQENLDEVLSVVKSQSKTLAYERDVETGEVLEGRDPIGVDVLFNSLLSEINSISTHYSNEAYIDEVTKVFNKYVYSYNTDTGIMNAKFDYVVGTKTSAMVNSFTEVVRSLYNNGEANYNPVTIDAKYNENVSLYFPKGVGYAGAISAPFLEEASNYTGYHIVLFTGKLKNVPANKLTSDNVYDKLGTVKTSVSYNQTMFEYFYDKIARDSFESFKNNLVSDKSTTEYISANFSDLY